MMGTVITADPRIEEAGKVLRECGDEADWPENEEARFQLRWAKDALIEALDTYTRFRGGWLPPFPGDVEEALDAAADIAGDEAQAFRKVHRRHVPQKEAAKGDVAA